MLFYTSTALGPEKAVTIYAGKDKYENDDLLKYRTKEELCIWFHVDKFSSPHFYLDLTSDVSDNWDKIPEALLQDIGQLVKAGSIMGNKKDNVQIIYTPTTNLRKDGSMDVGSVTFHRDHAVRRFHVATRDNAIVNRLTKTRVERSVDHEAERVEREKDKTKRRRAEANERKNLELETARARKAEAAARDYASLHQIKGTEEEEDEEWERQQRIGDFDPGDDFM